MIRSNVKVFDFFPEISVRVDELARNSVQAAAEAGAEVAAGIGAERNATDVKVMPAHGTLTGYAAGVEGRWYYRFQSYGTLSHAINPKRPGTKRDHSKGGITPNRMFQKARTAGRRALLSRISHGL